MSEQKHVDLNVRGIIIPRMRVITAQRKGRCDRTREWFQPGATIAFKHKDELTDEMVRVLFGDGPVFHVTVLYQAKKTAAKTAPRPEPQHAHEDDIPF